MDPLAGFLIHAYVDTANYSRDFFDDYSWPLTVMAKVHRMRSIIQAFVSQDDRFLLGNNFAEFGRVEIEDRLLGRHYLLRSESAVKIECFKRQQEALFEWPRSVTSEVVLLVHKFHKQGLDLFLAGTQLAVGGRNRLEAMEVPRFVGTWTYEYGWPAPFDQREVEAFRDVGALDELGEEGVS